MRYSVKGEMALTYFEKILLNFLRGSKIKMEITGFDMEGFEQALNQELRRRLETIECIAFEDNSILSDTKKVACIQNLFKREFYDKE